MVSNVFNMEWFELDNCTKQSLLMIMKRGAIPIELTSAYVISMNLDSFVGVSMTFIFTAQLAVVIENTAVMSNIYFNSFLF